MNPDQLRAVFKYEPESGRLIRKRTGREITGPFKRKGLKAKYETASIDGKLYVASRVIWALYTGEWPSPDLVIDHINGNTHDNRICNLRLVTNSENIRNSYKARAGKLKRDEFKTLINAVNDMLSKGELSNET